MTVDMMIDKYRDTQGEYSGDQAMLVYVCIPASVSTRAGIGSG
jgi:hypothetical protein